ncbi:trehalose-6-phosphate synthase [Methanobacterium sp. A39]|uniref:alpha,alpha-trehalose-phosphate synthase (UDP-forming) n=1 Tax=Methanobacterium sp. A39 TaxID=1860100 RepID=UPI002101555F|nr:trehalose-6-phosphate synthase [Methanobacterium sp. A39]
MASNRGPIEFFYDVKCRIEMKIGAGGIVPTLLPFMEKTGGTWVASAMTNADMEMAGRFPENRIPFPLEKPKLNVQFIMLDKEKYYEFYNSFHNPFLWFIHHYLWNLTYTPEIDDSLHHAWQSYQYVNQKFAEKIIKEVNSSNKEPLIMLQDTHLQTCPTYIREKFDDIFLSQFIHIPWPHPDYFNIYPRYISKAIIEGLLSNNHLGFHTKKYVKNFLMTCEKYAEEVDFKNNIVHYNGRETFVKNYPISVDIKKLNEFAKSNEVLKQEQYVKKIKGNNFLIYRTERTDPSKNIIRGFKAYDLFFQKHPEFKGKVTFFITGVTTRENVKEYADYKTNVNNIITEINEKYSKNGWKPIVPHFDAEYSLVTAALKNYDCLLINSINDGMNIVPKEGSTLNENNGVLIISETTGAYDELKENAININALDITETADAIYKAVTMKHDQRKKRLNGLKNTIYHYDVYKWMGEQFNDIQKLF